MDGARRNAKSTVRACRLVHYCKEVVEAEGINRAESYARGAAEAPVVIDFEDAFRVPGHGVGWSILPQSFPPTP